MQPYATHSDGLALAENASRGPRRYLYLFIIALSLGGCAATGVTLTNPRTGATALCPASWSALDPWVQTEACVGRYEAASWVRAPEH